MQTWLLLDPLFILLRNNITFTRGKQRTGKYQTMEKAAQGVIGGLFGA